MLCSDLISSLLVTYELDTAYANSESDTSSVEILKTLTTQMLHSAPTDSNAVCTHSIDLILIKAMRAKTANIIFLRSVHTNDLFLFSEAITSVEILEKSSSTKYKC